MKFKRLCSGSHEEGKGKGVETREVTTIPNHYPTLSPRRMHWETFSWIYFSLKLLDEIWPILTFDLSFVAIDFICHAKFSPILFSSPRIVLQSQALLYNFFPIFYSVEKKKKVKKVGFLNASTIVSL